MKQTTQTTINKNGVMQDNITKQETETLYQKKADALQLTDQTPLMDGTANVGTSTMAAHGDHRHPHDSSKADVNGTYPDMTVGNADTLANARAIDGVNFNGSAAITHYGVCSTVASTKEKTIALAGFTLVTGAKITVNFTTANTVSMPTLNVNGTGAKAMKCKERTTFLSWRPEIMTLVYDGTNWCIIDGYSLADRPVNTHHIQFNGESAPAALFGGTWQIDTDYTGRVLVGSGTGYTLGATGGSSTHNHDLSNVIACMTRDYETYPELIYLSKNSPSADGYTGDKRIQVSSYEDNNVFRYESTGIAVQGITDLGDSVQPYKVVAMWKRTA